MLNSHPLGLYCFAFQTSNICDCLFLYCLTFLTKCIIAVSDFCQFYTWQNYISVDFSFLLWSSIFSTCVKPFSFLFLWTLCSHFQPIFQRCIVHFFYVSRSSLALQYYLFSPGEWNGTPLQYSCLENPMGGRAWWATVHRVAKNQTGLSELTFTFTFTTSLQSKLLVFPSSSKKLFKHIFWYLQIKTLKHKRVKLLKTRGKRRMYISWIIKHRFPTVNHRRYISRLWFSVSDFG